jgi:hypothetical protein
MEGRPVELLVATNQALGRICSVEGRPMEVHCMVKGHGLLVVESYSSQLVLVMAVVHTSSTLKMGDLTHHMPALVRNCWRVAHLQEEK